MILRQRDYFPQTGKGYICQCGFSQYQGHVQSLYGIDADDQKERVCSFRQTFKYSKVKREEEICSLLQMQPDEQLVVAEKLFLADDKICAFCRDYFGMNLIGGEEAFDMFSKYEDSIYKYIYELSGEKAQWDKVEIDTVNPAEIAGLKKYVSVKELGLSPYLYLKTLNYSEKDKPLVYANEYFNTEIIKFNLIRQKNIQY